MSAYSFLLGGAVFSVLAIGPKVRGFKPGRGRWIFEDDRSPQHALFKRRTKAVGPMYDLTAR
jgi:hypothetical protein